MPPLFLSCILSFHSFPFYLCQSVRYRKPSKIPEHKIYEYLSEIMIHYDNNNLSFCWCWALALGAGVYRCAARDGGDGGGDVVLCYKYAKS